MGIGEFAAGINERRDGGITPQFHRLLRGLISELNPGEGQILDLP
jgi:hypothetical protein